MPSQTRVKELISYVEQGRFLEAYREFYHEDVAIQENSGEPRLGLAASLEHETQLLAVVVSFDKICAKSFLVDGDRVAIRWNFDATLTEDRSMQRDEIAYQRWDGDKIVCEQYFYDPNKPPPPEASVPGRGEKERETVGAASVVVDDQGQITLPEALLRQYDLAPGDRFLISDAPMGLRLWIGEKTTAK